MSIANECMVVSLHLGVWEGRKFDKGASDKATRDAGASEDVARVNKLLVPKEALAPLTSMRGAIYNHFISRTLPWKDNGDRILSRKMYNLFHEEHRDLVEKFRAAVDKFIGETYPAVVAQAQFRMAALFKAEDYPRPDQLRGRFYVSLSIDAITEGGDFRCSIDAAYAAEIKARIDNDLMARINKVTEQVWRKLAEAVEHYAERVRSDGRLYDSVKDNLIELCGILPGLNVTNDPELRALGKEIIARLEGFDIKEMRHPTKGAAIREAAATEAAEIAERMKGFMAAFGQSEDAE
jgi:class 3 adenylate cyclase